MSDCLRKHLEIRFWKLFNNFDSPSQNPWTHLSVYKYQFYKDYEYEKGDKEEENPFYVWSWCVQVQSCKVDHNWNQIDDGFYVQFKFLNDLLLDFCILKFNLPHLIKIHIPYITTTPKILMRIYKTDGFEAKAHLGFHLFKNNWDHVYFYSFVNLTYFLENVYKVEIRIYDTLLSSTCDFHVRNFIWWI